MRRRVLLGILLPWAGIVLLAGRAAGGASGGEGSGGVVRPRAPSSSSPPPPSSSSWQQQDNLSDGNSRAVAGDGGGSGGSVLADAAGLLRLRGGWLGVDLVREIAKSYLTPEEGHEGKRGGGGDGNQGRGNGGRTAKVEEARGGDKSRPSGSGKHGSSTSKNNHLHDDGRGGDSPPRGGNPTNPNSSNNNNSENNINNHSGVQSQIDRMRRRAAVHRQQQPPHVSEGGDVSSASPEGGGGSSSGAGSSSSTRNRGNSRSHKYYGDDGGFSRSSSSNGFPRETGDGYSRNGGETSAYGTENINNNNDRNNGQADEEDRGGGREEEWGVTPPQEGGQDDGEDYRNSRGDSDYFYGSPEEVELERARAAAEAAARRRSEIEFLRELEGFNTDQGGQGTEALAPLGQHTKSVVTEAMPQRFVDEVGAHIASALAITVVKGLIQTIMHFRGQKKPEKATFSDVIGCDEAKEEVKQIVDYLVDPTAYDKLGAARPKGILLVGPPGTGKTLIAKACAGEAGVPFLSACGSDFNGVYVGMGVAAVKRLFAKARRHKKSIIYIDEIDYLGRSRNSGGRDASGATQDREATLNQLLSEMDGFEGKDGIVVMASTNRKEILDDALLRSGRFDMQVDVERPDRRGRQQLFSKYMASLKLSDGDETLNRSDNGHAAAKGSGACRQRLKSSNGSISSSMKSSIGGNRSSNSRGRRYFGGGGAAAERAAEREKEEEMKKIGLRSDLAKELADLTPYMTGADVANVCATAGRIAARAGSDAVTLEHFSSAVDRVCHGLEKPGKDVPEQERERTAIHEAGHATAAWMLPWCDEVVKVSIVWRGNALGFSQTAKTERLSDMRETLLDIVCMILSGRAAEEVICGTISGGASSDLRKASSILYKAITEVGFGDATGLLTPGDRPTSEKVMADVDQEVQTILAEQYQRSLALIRRHRDKIDLLSSTLLENGVVHKAELENIFGDKVTVESAAAEAALAATTDAESTAEKRPAAGGSNGFVDKHKKEDGVARGSPASRKA